MQQKYRPAKEAINRVLAIQPNFPQARRLAAHVNQKLAEGAKD